MFAKNNNSVKFGDDRELATFPTLPNLVSVENDATLAKSATAVGYAHKRKIEQMTRCARIMGAAVKQLVEVVSLQLEKLQDAADKCKSLTKATEGQINFFTRFLKWSGCGETKTIYDIRSHEVSRALLEAAAAPVDSDTSLAELCRQVLVFYLCSTLNVT